MASPLAKTAASAPASANAAPSAPQYRDVGYVGVAFEHVITPAGGVPFTVTNLSFDRDTDFGLLAQALASGKLLTLRNRNETSKRADNMSHNIVLREKVA